MDKQTESLALNSMARMEDLSAHRIVEEMKRMFKDENPPETISRLFELQFWQQLGADDDIRQNSFVHASQLDMMYDTHPHFRTNNISWFDYFIIPFYHSGKT